MNNFAWAKHGVDLIGHMPDDILVLILSRLSSTEEQIRSSILSRRWKYLWTAIPLVDMQSKSGGKFKQGEFKEFVYWVLSSRTIDLDCFRLCLKDHYSIPTIWRWIHMAVRRNVKQLQLSFCIKETEAIELPHSLMSCGSLEVLRLNLSDNATGLTLPKVKGFPALRVFELTGVYLLENEDLVKDFFKCCPLLEELSLLNCVFNKLDFLCISCPKLKRLRIINWWHEENCDIGIKISCPNLVFLELKGLIGFNLFFDQPLVSLKDAVIEPKEMDLDTAPVLFPRAKPFWMYICFYSECIDAARDPILPNLKTLVLHTTIDAYTFDELIRLLKYCPKLESLKLTIAEYFSDMVDEVEAPWISTPDVKRVGFFEINGEKPKLVISNDCNCKQIVATWGKQDSIL